MTERPVEELIGWVKRQPRGHKWQEGDGWVDLRPDPVVWHHHAEVDDLATWLRATTGAPHLSVSSPPLDPDTYDYEWGSDEYTADLWGEGYAERPFPLGRGAGIRDALVAAVRKVAAS